MNVQNLLSTFSDSDVIIFYRWIGQEPEAMVTDGSVYDALWSFFNQFDDEEVEAAMILTSKIDEDDVDETKPFTIHYQEHFKDRLIFTAGKVNVLKEHLESIGEVLPL